MNYFFTYKDQLPKDIAVGTFSETHLIILAIIFLAMIASVVYLKRQSNVVQDNTIKVIAWSVVLLELTRMIWIVMINKPELMPVAFLPFHLCGLMAIFIPLAVYTKSDVLIEFVYVGGIAGAGMALLTPDVSMYPLLSLQFIQSMTIHAFIFFSGIFYVFVKGYRPKVKNAPKVLLLLILLAFAVFPVNILLQNQQANYFFLMYGIEDTILYTIDQMTNHLGYLLSLATLVIILVFVMYTPWFFVKRKQE